MFIGQNTSQRQKRQAINLEKKNKKIAETGCQVLDYRYSTRDMDIKCKCGAVYTTNIDRLYSDRGVLCYECWMASQGKLTGLAVLQQHVVDEGCTIIAHDWVARRMDVHCSCGLIHNIYDTCIYSHRGVLCPDCWAKVRETRNPHKRRPICSQRITPETDKKIKEYLENKRREMDKIIYALVDKKIYKKIMQLQAGETDDEIKYRGAQWIKDRLGLGKCPVVADYLPPDVINKHTIISLEEVE